MHDKSVVVVMSPGLFGSLFDKIERMLTPSGFARIFCNAGKKSGANVIELFEKRYGSNGNSLGSVLAQSTEAIARGKIEEFKMIKEAL